MIDFGSAEAGRIEDESERGQGVRIFAGHFITPVDETTCIDHWLHVRNFSQGDREVDERLHGDSESRSMRTRRSWRRSSCRNAPMRRSPRVKLAIDAGPMLMRGKVKAMIEAERVA